MRCRPRPTSKEPVMTQFIPLTDELLYDPPARISGPLVPYVPGCIGSDSDDVELAQLAPLEQRGKAHPLEIQRGRVALRDPLGKRTSDGRRLL